jgi:hypothetical protein
VGNSFSTAGLLVRAAYADGSSVTIESGYTLSWDGRSVGSGDIAITAAAGTKTVTVGWHDAAVDFTISVNEPGEPISVAGDSDWANALSTITNGGNGTAGGWKDYTIELTGDFALPGSTAYTFGSSLRYVTVNLTGSNTVSLNSQGNLFQLYQDQTLVIDGPTLRGLKYGEHGASQDNNAPVVYLGHADSTLELRSGAISGNGGGGGVSVGSGSFTMSGGTISGNSGYGGGVSVDSGSFTLSGGTISGNYKNGGGGGVQVINGSFTMSDGEISGNSSGGGNYGGGVSVTNGSFTMSGGKISGNSYGGGVCVNGAFTMSGGTISGNTGMGGVYVWGCSFTMSGGTISGNSGGSGGGGVYVDSGSFPMAGGTISGNSSTSGGGVYVGSGGTFSKSDEGGIIYGYDGADPTNPLWNKAGNGASTYGHAVYFGKDNGYYRDTTLEEEDEISTAQAKLPTTATGSYDATNWIKK